MVLEAYAGKYSIWLSNKEAAQGKVLRVSKRFKIADWNSPIRSDLWVERVGAGGNFISSETPQTQSVFLDFWTSVYTNNYGILKDDLTLQPNGDVTLEAHVGACSIVLTSQKVESVPVTKKQKVMRKFKVRKQQTKFIKQVDETEIELDDDDHI